MQLSKHDSVWVMAFAFPNAPARLCYQLSSVIGALCPSVVFGYKGIFLSYETQSVRLEHVNDSRFVGMSIYKLWK
ncbi:hypothetical protein RRG08_038372 [Elysia crispata]|uniref:Uncharacterized protein n=1 Tax=Elysia crispata TaxID=231223 RepID=A0AAE1A9H6_9GAST|nr:hypothetical protein RRG08_038372 [Elysia crispata]